MTEPGEKSAAYQVAHVRGALALGSVTPRLYRGRDAAYWAARFRAMRQIAYQRGLQTRRARRTLLASSTVSEAIGLAATVYGNGSLLWSLARCETGGTFSPGSYNRSGASGLFQFLPSTFASTPYGRFSIWSPYANALAAGWMLAQGRRSEWVC